MHNIFSFVKCLKNGIILNEYILDKKYFDDINVDQYLEFEIYARIADSIVDFGIYNLFCIPF